MSIQGEDQMQMNFLDVRDVIVADQGVAETIKPLIKHLQVEDHVPKHTICFRTAVCPFVLTRTVLIPRIVCIHREEMMMMLPGHLLHYCQAHCYNTKSLFTSTAFFPFLISSDIRLLIYTSAHNYS